MKFNSKHGKTIALLIGLAAATMGVGIVRNHLVLTPFSAALVEVRVIQMGIRFDSAFRIEGFGGQRNYSMLFREHTVQCGDSIRVGCRAQVLLATAAIINDPIGARNSVGTLTLDRECVGLSSDDGYLLLYTTVPHESDSLVLLDYSGSTIIRSSDNLVVYSKDDGGWQEDAVRQFLDDGSCTWSN